MHLGTPALLDFYRAHEAEQALVLVTIIGTEGSTYRKPGAMMLISRDGKYEGMISGGCLEGDLLEHAASVFSSGVPKFVTYDLHADEDLVWSLGLGCDGVIHLLLQRLDRERNFDFLAPLSDAMARRVPALLALSVQAEGSPPPGTLALLDASGLSMGDPALIGLLGDATELDWPNWRCRSVPVGAAASVLLVNIPPRTRVLICGAGPDAVPVAGAIAALGWEVVLVDHRPAYARAERFPAGCRLVRARPENLAAELDLDRFDAAVIMSHHLENDSVYLGQLCERNIPYLGVLGPRARRTRLRDMSGCSERSIYGPVGLDIGAELPESIALSLVAEIHAVLNGRDGAPLTGRGAGDGDS
ncbi:MAG: XdhC family protein [Xanthomonadales bacterium]|nr:XdhC family protein [Xanthomonadales bacterium]